MSDNPIPGATIIEDTTVPACEPWSAKLKKGEYVRFIDLEGKQAIDFLCYSQADPTDRYNAANTLKLNKNIYVGKGTVLWSVRANKMMTVVDDTCGRHDTIFGACSVEIDNVRYGKNNGRGCQGNFEAELAKHGMGPKDVVANVNLFMNCPVKGDGSVTIEPSISKPGDYIDLRAEMDVLCVISNCPETMNESTGGTATPIRAIVYSK